MNEHKLTSSSFESGHFHKELSHSFHLAGLEESSRARITGAMQDAIEHVAQTHDLRLGVGKNHLDEMLHYIDKNYHQDQHHSLHLRADERAHLEHALRTHFGVPHEAANDSHHASGAAA